MRSPLIAAASLTLAAALSLSAQSAPPPPAIPDAQNGDADLVGIYACEGKRPDGVEYSGTVEIVRNDGTYQLLWTLPPQEQYLGIGIRNGDVLAVSYFGGMPGVAAYRIERGETGPRLIGTWTVVDADGHVFPETLTRLAQGVTTPAPSRPMPRPNRARPSRGVRPV